MKVSVVLPTHNRANILEKSLQSVVNQTYRNLEIIVVSDGSTDNTDTLLSEYKTSDSRINYISYHPNKGGNHARNVGIKNATGDFIAFLDDDDEWVPEKIHLQIQEFMKNPKVGLIYTGAEIIYNKNKLSYKSTPKKFGDLSKDILISNYIGSTSSVMVKTSILAVSGEFDEKLKAQQDYDLWIRICQLTSIGFVSKPLLKYHNYNSTKQISDDLEKYVDSIVYINKKYEYLYKKVDDIIKVKHRQSSYMFLSTKSLRNNNPKVARRYILKHFKNNPNFKAILMYIITFLKYETILKLRSLIN